MNSLDEAKGYRDAEVENAKPLSFCKAPVILSEAKNLIRRQIDPSVIGAAERINE